MGGRTRVTMYRLGSDPAMPASWPLVTEPTLALHGYWRSSAAYRVRIALNLKGLPYYSVPHDLRTRAQHAPSYLKLSPQGLVPTLVQGDFVLTQSLAILEWIEERHPEPRLLPMEPNSRALVRSMAALIACDVHPLHNLRVLNALRESYGATAEQVSAWTRAWMTSGLDALEVQVARYGGRLAFGDNPSLADCCLIPQMYSAERYAVELARYPQLVRVAQYARSLPSFIRAQPHHQEDADPL